MLFNAIYFMLGGEVLNIKKIREIRAASRGIISKIKCNIHMALHSLSFYVLTEAFSSFFKNHQVNHPQPKSCWQYYQT